MRRTFGSQHTWVSIRGETMKMPTYPLEHLFLLALLLAGVFCCG
jgi:hypothetical protein